MTRRRRAFALTVALGLLPFAAGAAQADPLRRRGRVLETILAWLKQTVGPGRVDRRI